MMFDPRSGELRYDPVPLEQYGLADKWRGLAERQHRLLELDRERKRAVHAVRMAEEGITHAKEQDAEAAGAAILKGKAIPKARHEPKAEAERAEAERLMQAYSRAVQHAAEELYAFRAEHADELYADFAAARKENAAEMAALAPELASRYAQDFALADLVKKLTPPPAAIESDEPPRSSMYVIGGAPQTMDTIVGVPRGTVELVLAHLGGLVQEFEEPAEEASEQGAA